MCNWKWYLIKQRWRKPYQLNKYVWWIWKAESGRVCQYRDTVTSIFTALIAFVTPAATLTSITKQHIQKVALIQWVKTAACWGVLVVVQVWFASATHEHSTWELFLVEVEGKWFAALWFDTKLRATNSVVQAALQRGVRLHLKHTSLKAKWLLKLKV